jgi:hypothetical protein
MALRIETFDNVRGGNTLYKALTHPHAAGPGRELVAALADGGPVAVVDPHGAAAGFAEIFGLVKNRNYDGNVKTVSERFCRVRSHDFRSLNAGLVPQTRSTQLLG